MSEKVNDLYLLPTVYSQSNQPKTYNDPKKIQFEEKLTGYAGVESPDKQQ